LLEEVGEQVPLLIMPHRMLLLHSHYHWGEEDHNTNTLVVVDEFSCIIQIHLDLHLVVPPLSPPLLLIVYWVVKKVVVLVLLLLLPILLLKKRV
jgi:hypothetical protein